MSEFLKVSDFKILSTLPEDYEYKLFYPLNDDILIMGKKDHKIIGFILRNNVLKSIEFKQE